MSENENKHWLFNVQDLHQAIQKWTELSAPTEAIPPDEKSRKEVQELFKEIQTKITELSKPE